MLEYLPVVCNHGASFVIFIAGDHLEANVYREGELHAVIEIF